MFRVRSKFSLVSLAIMASSVSLFVSPSASYADTTPAVALPYQSSGWSYQQTAYGEDQGFEQPSFNASSWPVGRAGFGTTGGECPWNNDSQVHTAWTPDTDMLLRHGFEVPAGATNVHVSGTVDNNADIYINGTLLQHVESGSCQANAIDVEVPAADVNSKNLLAIRATDLGSEDYIDVQVTYDARILPNIDAGTFANFTYLRNGGKLGCTTGFGIMEAGVRYETGAKHCIDNEDGTQQDNNEISVHQPMDITTSDDVFIFASSIDCSPPDPSACLLPKVQKGVTGDIMAWRPDISIPSDMVQTPLKLLPVLGAKSWQDVTSQRLCHYGAGSAAKGAAERCGNAFSSRVVKLYCADGTMVCDKGTVLEPLYGTNGDSGGPVYVYNKNRTGVYAIGITVDAGRDCLQILGHKTACLDVVEIIPISTVLSRLGGARLLTS